MTAAVYIVMAFVFVGAIGGLGFAIHYTATTNWWKSFTGRQVFAATASVTVFLVVTFASYFIDNQWWFLIVTVVAFALISVTQLTMWLLFINTRRRYLQQNGARTSTPVP